MHINSLLNYLLASVRYGSHFSESYLLRTKFLLPKCWLINTLYEVKLMLLLFQYI